MRTVLAVDIGGTQIKAARVGEDGSILDSRRFPTPETLENFRAMAAQIVDELGAGASAVGIGCKGIINPRTTRVESLPGTVRYLEYQVLAELFAVANAEARADNDARVALLGEHRWGAARGAQNVVMLTLGTGVGGGVLTDGHLLTGATGAAGHIGHYTIDADGIRCICGNQGCIETVFSSKAIEAAAYSVISRGVASAMLDGASCPTCAEVFSYAQRGDVAATEIVDKAVHALAATLAGLTFIFDPELIVLGGQIVEAGEFLLEPLRCEVWRRTRPLLRREVPLVRSALSDPSGVLGAAALALG